MLTTPSQTPATTRHLSTIKRPSLLITTKVRTSLNALTWKTPHIVQQTGVDQAVGEVSTTAHRLYQAPQPVVYTGFAPPRLQEPHQALPVAAAEVAVRLPKPCPVLLGRPAAQPTLPEAFHHKARPEAFHLQASPVLHGEVPLSPVLCPMEEPRRMVVVATLDRTACLYTTWHHTSRENATSSSSLGQRTTN